MNKNFIRVTVLSLAVLIGLASAGACYAQDPFTKLGRGVANTLTGWVELPKNIYDTSAQDNAFAGVTVGLAKGLGSAIVRTVSGLYEIVTFPFPLPENYKPVLEPEYVF